MYNETNLEGQTVLDTVAEENIPTMAPAELPRKRKARTPKETCRDIKELRKLSYKAMNNTELQTLCTKLNEENTMLIAQLEEARETASKAFTQYRQADENFKSLQHSSNAKMAHVQDVMRIAYQSVQMAGGQK